MAAVTAAPPVEPVNQADKPVEKKEDEKIDEQRKKLLNTVFRSLKRSHDLFSSEYINFPEPTEDSVNFLKNLKKRDEYGSVLRFVEENKRREENEMLRLPAGQTSIGGVVANADGQLAIAGGPSKIVNNSKPQGQLLPTLPVGSSGKAEDNNTRSLLPLKAPMLMKPKWHAPWVLYRVISGHTGWVRAIDVEPQNQWFASGGADRIIKIWDLPTGKLKLSLTGHISSVRAVKVSDRHPFLFSGGEDKQVKCWDLEYNKVVRHYHGHLSAVQALDVHPTLDVLVTTARDSTARVWDMRTKAQVHCFAGHTNTVADVVCQASDPQVITASHDSTVRLWDLAAGRSMCTLTHHKKSVRALALHPRLFMFASASPDNIKQWSCPRGEFMQNLAGHNTIINSMACNHEGVLVSAGDNGSMCFWDWRSGFCFQKAATKAQPGSIESEAGIYAVRFDKSGTRLITGEADKSIKMYKEDADATEETHPIVWRPEIIKRRNY
ncbi:unnamed protein product [Auanema sp. JU1783]|nr:unnamed protein product [Auanema sp. JU1783]